MRITPRRPRNLGHGIRVAQNSSAIAWRSPDLGTTNVSVVKKLLSYSVALARFGNVCFLLSVLVARFGNDEPKRGEKNSSAVAWRLPDSGTFKVKRGIDSIAVT